MAQYTANGSINNTYRLELNVNETYVSGGADNYSTVSWSVVLRSTGGYSFYTIGSTVVVNVDGQVYNAYSQKDLPAGGAITIASGSKNITHNSDGSKSINVSASYTQTATANYTPGNMSCSGTLGLTKIPRYATANQSLKSKTASTIIMNWSSDNIIDYIWYSTNSGSSWTGVDVSDGTSGTYTITGLTPDTTYNIKTRVRRRDSQLTTDSSTLSVRTLGYATSNQSLNNKTINSIKINWSSNNTVDYIWYSKDNGSSWTGIDVSDGTSGSYTISGLSANTSYNIKTRVRRKDSQLTTDSSTLTVTTYDYAKITEVPNITIGNNATVKYSNPSGSTINISLYKTDGSTVIASYRECSGSSYTFNFTSTEISNMYNNCKTSTSVTLRYYLRTTCNGTNYYSYVDRVFNVNTNTNKPIFTNFEYKDVNERVVALTGNNQKLVNYLSETQIKISSANKAVAQNGASIIKYRFKFESYSNELSYSTSDLSLKINALYTNNIQPQITVTAVDSRGLETSVIKTPIWVPYEILTINYKATREKGIGTTVFFDLNGFYWFGNFGQKENTLTAHFNYRKKGDTDWILTDAIDITTRLKLEKGKFSTITAENINFLPNTDNGTVPLEFEFGQTYEIQFIIEDCTGDIRGYPRIFTLSSGIPATSKVRNEDGTYSIGVNKLPDKNYAFSVSGNTNLNGYDMNSFLVRNEGISIDQNRQKVNCRIYNNTFTFYESMATYGILQVVMGELKDDNIYNIRIKGFLTQYDYTNDTDFQITLTYTSRGITNTFCKISNQKWLKSIYVGKIDGSPVLSFVHTIEDNYSYDEWQDTLLTIEKITIISDFYGEFDESLLDGNKWQAIFSNTFLGTENQKCGM